MRERPQRQSPINIQCSMIVKPIIVMRLSSHVMNIFNFKCFVEFQNQYQTTVLTMSLYTVNVMWAGANRNKINN